MSDEQQATRESTAVAVRGGFDLTRAPWQQWDSEMVELTKRTVLKRAASNAEVYFCLALADSLQLNPFAEEIYFIPSKAQDGEPAGVKPYIGRTGLVKKAELHNAYFDSDTVRANDKFRVVRKPDGTRSVSHSYSGTAKDRGEIVGAWAEVHFRDGMTRPGFFFAELSEYLPTFDQEWKMRKSPWGNQRAAMIEKCAMIGAARQRIPLGGVLIDAEIDRVMQQRAGVAAPGPGVELGASDFDWASLPEAVGPRLAAAVAEALAIDEHTWPAARCEMVFKGQPVEVLVEWAERIERENAAARERGPVVDAEVVEGDLSVEQRGRVEMLQRRLEGLQRAREGAQPGGEEDAALAAEMDQVAAEIRSITGGAAGQQGLDI